MEANMDNGTYNSLMNMIKIFRKGKISIPDNGKHNFQDLHDAGSRSKEFELLINRKGHLREDVLTYQMRSKESGLLIRLDMTGPSHDDRDGNPVNTPHLHIFNEEYNDGKWAIALSDIIETPIMNLLHDSLSFFLLYNKVDISNIQVPII
jgi:hypothetical protein